MMKDYAGALADLNKADSLDPNNSFILQYVQNPSLSSACFLQLRFRPDIASIKRLHTPSDGISRPMLWS